MIFCFNILHLKSDMISPKSLIYLSSLSTNYRIKYFLLSICLANLRTLVLTFSPRNQDWSVRTDEITLLYSFIMFWSIIYYMVILITIIFDDRKYIDFDIFWMILCWLFIFVGYLLFYLRLYYSYFLLPSWSNNKLIFFTSSRRTLSSHSSLDSIIEADHEGPRKDNLCNSKTWGAHVSNQGTVPLQ